MLALPTFSSNALSLAFTVALGVGGHGQYSPHGSALGWPTGNIHSSLMLKSPFNCASVHDSVLTVSVGLQVVKHRVWRCPRQEFVVEPLHRWICHLV